jgi:serine/threonine-protein kinase HipA
MDREARPFFAGLLPDDEVRRNLARYLGVSDRNDFALLEIVGGECAGAIALYPEGREPQVEPGKVEELSEQSLAEIIRSLPTRPLFAGGELRLSLAGAQDKIAVCLIADKIGLPKHGFPTTHILKPAIERFQDTVHNELFCMRLASRLGLAVPRTELRSSSAGPFLLVERYDRTTGEDGVPVRLHQEDFCQALGIPPEMRYQSEGGPSLPQCFALLQEHGVRPAVDRLSLLDAVLFNYLIGNADAHGKNFSLLHETGGVRLAPLYDLVSTLVYPELSPKMAMKVGGKYKFDEVLGRHWNKFAREAGLSPAIVERRLRGLAQTILPAATAERELLVAEGAASPLFDSIVDTVRERAAAV